MRLYLVGLHDPSFPLSSPLGGASGDSSRWRILHGQDLQAADSRIRRSACLRDGVKGGLGVGWVTKQVTSRLIPRWIKLVATSSTPFALIPAIAISLVPPALTLDDSLPGRFIGTFVATIGWVISSVIRAHHAETAFDDFSSLPVAALLLVLVVVAIASVQIRSLSNIVALAATDDVAWLQNAMSKRSRERPTCVADA